MTMNCEHVDNVLSAWFEGDLDLPQRRAVDAHLRECLRCASIVRDIEALRRDAANLPELTPSRDLWDGIAARIETPVLELAPRQAAPAPARRTWQMAAAAVVLMAVSSGVTYLLATGEGGRGTGEIAFQDTMTAAPESSQSDVVVPSRPAGGALLIRSEAMAAEVVYDQEITRLRTILDQRRTSLDTTTINTVERSLLAIDRAIEDARQALAADASSLFLTEQLNRALEKKVGVLRRVALLPVGAS
jgi:anti-sigma factor RsiW